MSLLKNCSPNPEGMCASNPLSRRRFYLLFIIFLVFSSITVNATVYYVSATGNDSNSGTSPNQPWKSLTKVNSFSPKPGDQILFNRGEEWIGTITVKASGSSGNPVIYGAYGTGSNPRIYGSQEITGWKLHSGNIYKATVNSNIEQLFVNDKRSRLARYPNKGYFNTTKLISTSQFSSTELKGGVNYAGATWIGRTSAFTMHHMKVTGSSSQTIKLESAPSYGLGVNKGFFLANKLEFLDQAGEWYYDPSTKTVYLWAPNGDSPANYKVRGSTSAYGINISDKNYIVIKDFEILHSSNSGIYINKANYLTIENNRIISPDLFGINMISNSQSPVFKNNYIYQAGGGIRCFGSSATITDNTIEDTGLLENINRSVFAHDNYGTAIFSRNSYPKITYNRIINAGYNGINWKGINGDISYNYINGACQVLDDGGGIYTYNGYDYKQAASAGSVVKNNIVLNVYGNPDGYHNNFFLGFGIYMDNAIHRVTIENNTVAGATGAIFINPCGLINIRNNTVMDATLHLLINGEFEKSTITGNLFYTTNRGGYFKWWGQNASQRIVYQESGAKAIFNHNTYIASYEPKDVFVNMKSFAEWKSKTGQDTQSTFDDKPMGEGEKEHLFYNDTKQTKTIDLGSSVYRDIKGTIVSKSFTLQPFTSKILIKTKSVISNNKSPVILDQTFNIYAPKTVNDLIGQVVAHDPDNGQTLSYSIINGNAAGLFTINSATGKIYTKSDIKSTVNQSIVLVVEVKDNAVYPLSATASVTLHIIGVKDIEPVDITSPVISSFTIPSAYTSLTIPILTFTATDNLAVTGYKLTETPTAPLVSDIGWKTSAPTTYAFSQSGIKALYAWTKDAAGNISNSVYRSVTITLTEKVTEYVTICAGEEYMGWSKSGEYQRTVANGSSVIVNEENLIANSDFSNGTGGWTSWGLTGYKINLSTNNQQYISAPASMQVSCTANGPEINSLHLITGGKIAVEAGKQYELTFYAKGTVGFTIGRLFLFKASTPWTHYGSFEVISPKVTKDWQRHKIKFTATHSASDAQIRMYLGNSLPAGQSLFLDDVVFAKYSEEVEQVEQIVTTYLTVNPVLHSTEKVTIAEGENYMGWTVAGEYQRTLVSAAGCDSLVITVLSVSPLQGVMGIEEVSEYVTICEGEEYKGWTKSGVYQRTEAKGSSIKENLIANSDFSNGTGGWATWGSSGYKIDLTKNEQQYISAPASMQVHCTANGTNISALRLITGGKIAVEAGKQYELTFYARATIGFTIGRMYLLKTSFPYTHYGSFEVVSPQVTEDWQRHKIKFTATHSASDAQFMMYLGRNLPAGQSLFLDDVVFAEFSEEVQQLEQIVTTYLTVNPVSYSTEKITIAEGENYLGWTETGEYQRTLVASSGCDSLVITSLTVVSFPKTPTAKAAVITSLSGWEVPILNDFVLYPNPARSFINIDYTLQPEDIKIEIMDGSGRTIYNQKAESVSNRINTNHLPSGVYYLRSLQGQEQKVIKFIIQ